MASDNFHKTSLSYNTGQVHTLVHWNYTMHSWVQLLENVKVALSCIIFTAHQSLNNFLVTIQGLSYFM